MAAPLALVLVVAVTVRAALFRSSLAEFISERVEVVSPLSSWKRGEATGSSRRSGPACALLASVNGRRGHWSQAQDSEGTDPLKAYLEKAGERGCWEEGAWGSGEVGALQAGHLRGGDLRGCVPHGFRAERRDLRKGQGAEVPPGWSGIWREIHT